ncbi:MAG: GNAT family N-acetyltransferase [Anaerolineae bacterium]|nr:GNAT family N-acetyltransferase [Anaerolineae bacterium]MDW8099449.1 GNAT family N-acetyltransferase [Anaerolineae bacterium]
MIEKARAEDGQQIRELTAQVNAFSPTDVACVEELWNAYLGQGEASGYSFLVYRESSRVVGFACFGPAPLTKGTFDLYWIAVDPASRGRGIGHALLERVEAEVQARGGRLLVVETSSTPAYAPARRFYEECGYHYAAVIHDFYAPGDDLIIFEKEFLPHSTSLAKEGGNTSAPEGTASALISGG